MTWSACCTRSKVNVEERLASSQTIDREHLDRLAQAGGGAGVRATGSRMG